MAHLQYSKAKTGDIILFSGWSLGAFAIRAVTYSEWTHAGVAVWLNTDVGRRLYIFEAASVNDEHCALMNDMGRGCRLVNIDQIMYNYRKVGIRKIPVKRDDEFYAKLREFIRVQKNREFPTHTLRFAMIMATSGMINRPKNGEGKMLCSEVCAAWLGHIGVIPTHISDHYPHYRATPECFVNDRAYPASLFDGPMQIVHDDGIDGTVRTAAIAVQVCSLFLYILLSVEDDTAYRNGHRRRKKNRGT